MKQGAFKDCIIYGNRLKTPPICPGKYKKTMSSTLQEWEKSPARNKKSVSNVVGRLNSYYSSCRNLTKKLVLNK